MWAHMSSQGFPSNAHHQERLGSKNTNHQGVAALDFATVCGSDQLVIGPTHARGRTLNLLITDVPESQPSSGCGCSTDR